MGVGAALGWVCFRGWGEMEFVKPRERGEGSGFLTGLGDEHVIPSGEASLGAAHRDVPGLEESLTGVLNRRSGITSLLLKLIFYKLTPHHILHSFFFLLMFTDHAGCAASSCSVPCDRTARLTAVVCLLSVAAETYLCSPPLSPNVRFEVCVELQSWASSWSKQFGTQYTTLGDPCVQYNGSGGVNFRIVTSAT